MSKVKTVYVRVKHSKLVDGYTLYNDYVVSAKWGKQNTWREIGRVFRDEWGWESYCGESGYGGMNSKWEAVELVVELAREHGTIP